MSGERSAATATERASLGSFLFTVPGIEKPHPRGELRLHIQNLFTAREQLLREQPPQSSGTLNRPDPLRPGRGPRTQILDLRSRSSNSDLPEPRLLRSERDRGMRSLVRVNPDHHNSHNVLLESDGPWRACLISDRPAFSPLWSHATARRDVLAPRSKARPDRAGRRFASQPIAPLGRYDSRRVSTTESQSDGYLSGAFGD